MAQKPHSAHQRKSDFPIYEYLEMVTPHHLIARFQEIPPHYRWLILSIIASSLLLWIFLKVVVGGLYAYIDSRTPRGFDALYLPYDLEARALPTLPETLDENTPFFVLPQTINDQYTLQVPPTEEELAAVAAEEREAFLALSVPAQMALETFQSTLPSRAEVPVTTQEIPAVTAEGADAQPGAEAADPAAASASATADAAPTVNPVQLQTTAVQIALPVLTTINDALTDSDSLQPAIESLPALQSALDGLAAAGVTLPELQVLNARVNELVNQKPPVVYRTNDCLVSSQIIVRRDSAYTLPCPIGNTATFVEQGTYVSGENQFNVAVAEYPEHAMATQAVKDIFNFARTIGTTGNFSVGPIAYDYVYSFADDLYTLTWSHETWVYSISAANAIDLDNLLKVFPY